MKSIYSILTVLCLYFQPLTAQDQKFALSKVTYEGIAKAQDLIEKNDYKEAGEVLNKLENSSQVRKRLDKAYVRFYIGYFYTLQNDFKQAVTYYEKALAFEALSPEQLSNTYLNLFQIYMDKEEYAKSLLYIDKLIAIAEPAKADYFVYKANVYLGLKEYALIIENLNKAFSLSTKPQPGWLKTQFYAYYMLEDYPNAIVTVKKLIEIEPRNKEYWIQLSSLYTMNKDFSASLSSLDISRIAKLELSEQEILKLVSWLRYSNVPYKAAGILEEKVDAGIVASSEKNLERLGDLYYESNEYDKSILWYKKAALLSEAGKIYYKIAQINSNNRKHEEVIKNIRLSLEKPDEDHLGEKYLLLAKAHYELGKIKEARSSFKEALNYKRSKKIAQSWLNYIDEKGNS